MSRGSRPTLDGQRTRLSDLQSQRGDAVGSGEAQPEQHRLKRIWSACNDFLMGMYTGESCAGTPHSERPDPLEKIVETKASPSDQDPKKED